MVCGYPIGATETHRIACRMGANGCDGNDNRNGVRVSRPCLNERESASGLFYVYFAVCIYGERESFVVVGSLFHTQYVLISMTTNYFFRRHHNHVSSTTKTIHRGIRRRVYLRVETRTFAASVFVSFRCVPHLFLCFDIYFCDRLRVVCCFIHSFQFLFSFFLFVLF